MARYIIGEFAVTNFPATAEPIPSNGSYEDLMRDSAEEK
jgi:hypothetical protein